MNRATYYKTCPDCGDNLDPGERCGCKEYLPNRDLSLPFIGVDLANGPDFTAINGKIIVEPGDNKSCKEGGILKYDRK